MIRGIGHNRRFLLTMKESVVHPSLRQVLVNSLSAKVMQKLLHLPTTSRGILKQGHLPPLKRQIKEVRRKLRHLEANSNRPLSQRTEGTLSTRIRQAMRSLTSDKRIVHLSKRHPQRMRDAPPSTNRAERTRTFMDMTRSKVSTRKQDLVW